MKPECDYCNNQLKYVAELGTPGIGKIYECTNCGKRYHNVGDTYTPMQQVDPEDLTLDPGDVI